MWQTAGLGDKVGTDLLRNEIRFTQEQRAQLSIHMSKCESLIASLTAWDKGKELNSVEDRLVKIQESAGLSKGDDFEKILGEKTADLEERLLSLNNFVQIRDKVVSRLKLSRVNYLVRFDDN